ncbi:MAG TPA: MarR family transcriptional regulator [Actinomycetota bacterium]|nr:MarR family transcriptional regulator [Actinomycetota bacterium]
MQAQTVDVAQLASRLRLGITRLARRLRREAETGITPSLLSALSTVEREGPMTISELGAAEHVQPPTVTRIVAALVQAGLLERWTDPGDRRVSWVRATPAGARLIARSRSRKDAYLARRLRHLEPHELAVLEAAAGILERLVEEGS